MGIPGRATERAGPRPRVRPRARARAPAAPTGARGELKKDRRYLKKTPEQLAGLEAAFAADTHPSADRREVLGRGLGLEGQRVREWFQNRRVKARTLGATSGPPTSGPRQRRVGASGGAGRVPMECPICMEPVPRARGARLDTCGHVFHRACISKWLALNNSCPKCRAPVRRFQGRRLKDRNLIRQGEEELVLPYTVMTCEVCGSGEAEDRMILCDSCDRGFHTFCLDPPLDAVPSGEWFCPTCRAAHIRSPPSSSETVSE